MASLIDSKQTMLPVEQIARIALENTKPGASSEEFIQSIIAENKKPGSIPIRYGNTLFLCHKDRDRTGVFRALNADTARNYVENIIKWVREAYKIGFDFMVTNFDSQSITNVFKAISRKFPSSNIKYKINKSHDGEIQVVLQLGPRRGVE